MGQALEVATGKCDNAADRGLRAAVIYRKLCLGSRSHGGERTIERPLSVDETCRLQRRSLCLPQRRAHRQSTAVDQSLLDQSRAGGGDALGTGAAKLGGDLAGAVGVRAEVRHRGEVSETDAVGLTPIPRAVQQRHGGDKPLAFRQDPR